MTVRSKIEWRKWLLILGIIIVFLLSLTEISNSASSSETRGEVHNKGEEDRIEVIFNKSMDIDAHGGKILDTPSDKDMVLKTASLSKNPEKEEIAPVIENEHVNIPSHKIGISIEEGEENRHREIKEGPELYELTIQTDDNILERERKEDNSVLNYDLIINNDVKFHMDAFKNGKRGEFTKWLSRSGKYIGMIQDIFKNKGLPEELAYTAMIESGFSPRAISRAGARGLWQFMEGTGRRYGLNVTRWVDERFDPIKSTIAAANYLSDLYSLFNSWFLAQAAYNAGEWKVFRGLLTARTNDFWQLCRTRLLRQETKQFVPLILAATIISKNPVEHGFSVEYLEPEEYEEIIIREPTDLRQIAAIINISHERLRELNPELRTWLTPFGVDEYKLKIPGGTKEKFEEDFQNMYSDYWIKWKIHRVSKGQTIGQVAHLYNTTPAAIIKTNALQSSRIRLGAELLIPSDNKEGISPPPGESIHVTLHRRDFLPGGVEINYTVKKGDTVSSIARTFGVKTIDIISLNNLDKNGRINPGNVLRIRASSSKIAKAKVK